MMGIRGEADIQHTPADITSLHGSPQVETSSGGVVQSDVLVFVKQRRKLLIQIKVLSAKRFPLVINLAKMREGLVNQ